MEQIRKIAFNIYADSDEEAEMGRKAIIEFIDLMGQHGAKVSGIKLSEAVEKLKGASFVLTQIIHFFKE